jgi:two-component system phosphate regulon sensor histidine kinase PhoR
MKTRAFVLRSIICFLLSLIPLTDLESLIYSERFELRGRDHSPSNVLIVEIPTDDFASSSVQRRLQSDMMARGAHEVMIAPRSDGKAFIYDADGVVRKAPAKALGQWFWIGFRGPRGSFQRCELQKIDLCNPKARDVLLVDEVEDAIELRTPVGEMPRSELIASVWNTSLTGKPIYRAPFWVRAILVLGMTLVIAFFIMNYPVMIHAVAVPATALVIVAFLFQLIFQIFALYIPSANLCASVLITYLVFTAYRLAYQENRQWRSLKQAQYLRELDEMKTNFLSLVSHDLKTPIAKIQAGVERLSRELNLTERQQELLESIENSNNELKSYILSILNLSRIESQQVILNKKSNDINLLIQQTLKRLRPLAQQKSIAIEERLETLFSVECDEDLMRQVLANLIDNAIKYSPSQSQVIVSSAEEKGSVRVFVKDSGPGIPKDQLPKMFRKFSRISHGKARASSESAKGSGLGLYLSKFFIEMHGGSIRVESEEGKGTTLSFTLPIQETKV